MKVLNADDDTFFLQIMFETLSEAGYEVVQAQTGREAIQKAVTEKPDIFILDIILPEFLGTEVCEKLRNYSQTSSIPILLVSSDFTDIKKAGGDLEDFKADGFLHKPFKADELLKLVQQLAGKTSKYASEPPPVENS